MNESLENEIKEELSNWNELKDKVLNVIPAKDISFRTRNVLSSILDRLELSNDDRKDLEKYIIYGGGENIEYIKSVIGDLLNKVPELNYLIDNIQTVISSLNKLDELFKDVDESLNKLDESLNNFKELYNTLNSLKTSINNLNTTHNNDIKQINNTLNAINQTINNDVLLKKDSPFEKGDVENSAVLKGGNNKTTNANEAALGKYNISNSDTRFSIGIGTSETNRKNAVEVEQNGDVYITGIGGYDGTNSTTDKSVQEVINELINKFNEITTND